MWRSFNVAADSLEFLHRSHQRTGEELTREYRNAAHQDLSGTLTGSSPLDARLIQHEWFPLVQADIFLSHSHRDRDLALRLAGWLKTQFGLRTFIDSCVWGHCAELLRSIDVRHCLISNGLFSYERRNQSTAHVHAILSMALTAMIDRTECVWFLNSPASVTLTDAVSNPKTNSAWLFLELSMMRRLRRRRSTRQQELLEKAAEFNRGTGPNVEYPVTDELASLHELSPHVLASWHEVGQLLHEHPLDTLYGLCDDDLNLTSRSRTMLRIR